MSKQWLLSSCCVAALLLTADPGTAQQTLPNGVTLRISGVVLNPHATRKSFIVRPASGQEQPRHAHTNVEMLVPQSGYPRVIRHTIGPPASGYLTETPASLACIYQTGLSSTDAGKGCNPNLVTALPTGGSHAIAIVDAYHYPTAAADLAAFNSQFGVTRTGTFQVIYAGANSSSTCNTGGTAPPTSTGWNSRRGFGHRDGGLDGARRQPLPGRSQLEFLY